MAYTRASTIASAGAAEMIQGAGLRLTQGEFLDIHCTYPADLVYLPAVCSSLSLEENGAQTKTFTVYSVR